METKVLVTNYMYVRAACHVPVTLGMDVHVPYPDQKHTPSEDKITCIWQSYSEYP